MNTVEQLSAITQALRDSFLYSGQIEAGMRKISENPDPSFVADLYKLLSREKGVLEIAARIRLPSSRAEPIPPADFKKAKRIKENLFSRIVEQLRLYFEMEISGIVPSMGRQTALRVDWKQSFTASEGDIESIWTFSSAVRRLDHAGKFKAFFQDLQVRVYEEHGVYLVDSSTDPARHMFYLHKELSTLVKWASNHPSVSELAFPPESIAELPFEVGTTVQFLQTMYNDEGTWEKGTTGTVDKFYMSHDIYYYDVSSDIGSVNVSGSVLSLAEE